MKIYENIKDFINKDKRLVGKTLFENAIIPIKFNELRLIDAEVSSEFANFEIKYMNMPHGNIMKAQSYTKLAKAVENIDVRLLNKKAGKSVQKLGRYNEKENLIYLQNNKDSLNYLMLLVGSYNKDTDQYGFIKKSKDGSEFGRRFSNAYAKILLKRYFSPNHVPNIEEELALNLEARLEKGKMTEYFFKGDYDKFEEYCLSVLKNTSKEDFRFVIQGINKFKLDDFDSVDRQYTDRLQVLIKEPVIEPLKSRSYLIKKDYR